MTERRKLVMATNNAGKLREARAIAGNKLEILSLDDIGYHHDIPETADTLAGNALLKARAIKEVCDLDVFADDTGLLVDALGGAPGVYTARYAGPQCSPDDNINLMLKNMEGIEDRHARFCTAIALSLDGKEHIFEGAVDGTIAKERSGSHGFGYDPIFVPDETGICFAEMTDEAKNAISHRGRAISAMMKWLGSLCLMLFGFLNINAAAVSDWTHFNTFDDGIEYVFDTEHKTYFLVRAQLYDPQSSDNKDKLCFLFCLDKGTDEVRPYNKQNYLSESLIRTAYYNAIKKYLLIVYDNMMIDILYDNGDVVALHALKDYSTAGSKEVRAISFDPENDMAYLATDFGFMAIDDEKHEVASSGIYDRRFDNVVRAGKYLLVVSDGKLYRDDLTSKHISFDDFKETSWAEGDRVTTLISLTSTKCVFAKKVNGVEQHYIMTFSDSNPDPTLKSIDSYEGASIVENKDGLLFTRTSQIVGLDRNTDKMTYLQRGGSEHYAVPVGSWDLTEAFYAKRHDGFYSMRRNDDNEWTVTRQPSRPNAPAAFRSNFMAYDPKFGMLVNSHGIDQNFANHGALNPILLSAYKNGEWKPLGIPYFSWDEQFRLVNPSGFAQDPDNPDLFYFGSVRNGLLRYNVNDYSEILHLTTTTDNPSWPGHVSVREPYSAWGGVFMMLNPVFDNKGNLFIGHINTDVIVSKSYYTELWVWSAERRKASVTPESFQPFKILKLNGLLANNALLPLPHQSPEANNMVSTFAINCYDRPFIVYDHNGTPDDDSDDRQVSVKSLYDNDGNIEYHYIYCAIEDPATGLVWVGTDNGVFTYNPALQFSDTGSANRIKVSRNDGTSLADYLLNGISINNISIDNRGRKWFSLASGGIVCTSSDGKTVIQEITTDNSMLPSDDVYATCYNPSNNSMMVATKAGLCEYNLNGDTSASDGSTARVYPNPVRPDYYGWVTIAGLEDDCIVKIADSAGNVIREIGPASGGKVQWDACNSRLDRVASGVYFILASGNGESSYSEVAKILVVKN